MDNPGESDPWQEIAWGMWTLAEALDSLINEADEDTDLTVLVDTRSWLLDRANIFAPPGETNGSHPREACPVINMESWRARHRS